MFLFFMGVLEIQLNWAVCPFQATVLAKLRLRSNRAIDSQMLDCNGRFM